MVDSLGFYSPKTQKPQWILLRQSPKINLDRLIDSLNPELIIWDGSNYKSDQERWKLSCITKKSLSIKRVKRALLLLIIKLRSKARLKGLIIGIKCLLVIHFLIGFIFK